MVTKNSRTRTHVDRLMPQDFQIWGRDPPLPSTASDNAYLRSCPLWFRPGILPCMHSQPELEPAFEGTTSDRSIPHASSRLSPGDPKARPRYCICKAIWERGIACESDGLSLYLNHSDGRKLLLRYTSLSLEWDMMTTNVNRCCTDKKALPQPKCFTAVPFVRLQFFSPWDHSLGAPPPSAVLGTAEILPFRN